MAICFSLPFDHVPLQDYDASDLDSFREIILSGCDTNNDGKVDKKELTMILMAINKDRTSSSSAAAASGSV